MHEVKEEHRARWGGRRRAGAPGTANSSEVLVRAMLEAEPGELLPFAGKADAIEVVAIAVA